MAEQYENLSDKRLIEALQSGAIGVLPTDTVYGVVGLAGNQAAVAKLYGLKKREHKPGTIIAANIEQFVDLGIKARYLKAVEDYWPGPVSIVIPCADLLYLHQGRGSLPIRISNDSKLNVLLEKVGPLLTSSANQPGQTPATTIAEAENYFGDDVDFYVDGGDLSTREPSTIIRIVDDAVEVLRKGAVNIDEETGKILS